MKFRTIWNRGVSCTNSRIRRRGRRWLSPSSGSISRSAVS
jgi:hypothetical protein